MASQRSAWEQQALSSLAASASHSREQALQMTLHPPPSGSGSDDADRSALVSSAASASADGMSAREKHALERRKRKALVVVRRDMIGAKEARRHAF
jgi:hypothetical protein